MTDWRVLLGDCRDVMAGMDAGSVDAIVCDPPYEIAFMSRAWDKRGVAFDPETWRAALRVLKPGGVLMAFGSPRTWHRLAVAIEDAGFALFDTIVWMHGQGFPKRKTLLKPAFEPIVLAKRPGSGGLHVEAGRIPTTDNLNGGAYAINGSDRDDAWGEHNGFRRNQGLPYTPPPGRWPPNVALDETAALLLDAMSGERKSGFRPNRVIGSAAKPSDLVYGTNFGAVVGETYNDSGGASRFMKVVPAAPLDDPDAELVRMFYAAKASRRERNLGLEGMPERLTHRYSAKGQGPLLQQTPSNGVVETNSHPTVKSLKLMQWLCRLSCPVGGTILDPFAGSGSTGAAAVLEGMRFIGIEMSDEYAAIAERRIAYWATQRPDAEQAPLILEASRAAD